MDPLTRNISSENPHLQQRIFILLVDDNDDQRFLFKTLLERMNYTVVTAACAAEAERILKEIHIDLVITDVNMPEVSGKALIERLRKANTLAHLPIIAFTAAQYADPEELLQSGADAHCQKTEIVRLLRDLNSLLTGQETGKTLLAKIRGRFWN